MVASLQLPKPEPVTTQLRPFSDPHWCVPEAEKRCIWASCRSLFRSLPEAGGPERIATVARLAIAQAGDRGERLSEIVMIYLLVSKPRSKPVRPPFVPTRRRRRELRPVRDRRRGARAMAPFRIIACAPSERLRNSGCTVGFAILDRRILPAVSHLQQAYPDILLGWSRQGRPTGGWGFVTTASCTNATGQRRRHVARRLIIRCTSLGRWRELRFDLRWWATDGVDRHIRSKRLACYCVAWNRAACLGWLHAGPSSADRCRAPRRGRRRPRRDVRQAGAVAPSAHPARGVRARAEIQPRRPGQAGRGGAVAGRSRSEPLRPASQGLHQRRRHLAQQRQCEFERGDRHWRAVAGALDLDRSERLRCRPAGVVEHPRFRRQLFCRTPAIRSRPD